MSDKVELIAAAQINAFAGPPAGITFNSNYGFKTATRSSPGSYELQLDHKHDAKKLVIHVTRSTALDGEIGAVIVGTGDVDLIQIANFTDGDASDTPFFISVYRVRS